MPFSAVSRNGVSSCQHSNRDTPFAAVTAVRFRNGVVRLLRREGAERLIRVKRFWKSIVRPTETEMGGCTRMGLDLI